MKYMDNNNIEKISIKLSSDKANSEQSQKTEHKKNIFISLFTKLIIFLGILSFAYLQIQLQPSIALFGQTQAKKTFNIENEILQKQAEINRFNLTIAAYSMDDFAFEAENYLSLQRQINSNLTTENTKQSLKMELEATESSLITSITVIQNALLQPLYSTGLKSSDIESKSIKFTENNLNEFKKKLASELSNAENKTEIRSEIQNINNIASLLKNNDLQSSIKNFNTEKLEIETVEKLLSLYYKQQTNNLSILKNISNKKILWINIINEIDLETKTVDPLYGSTLSERIGQIKYSNFQLEKDKEDNDKIIVSGAVNTPDGVNFTITSDLIDAFENSKMFKDVNMRSFSKKLNDENTYTGNFRIEFSLEK